MAVLKIYNEIQTEDEKRVNVLLGGISGICFKDIDAFCESLSDEDDLIDVRLHCSGGSCIEGWSIYDRLRATGKDITCTVEGNAASMATVILMAAPKERRRAYANAKLCVHNPWVSFDGMDGTMTADDLQKASEELRAEQDRILGLYVERCGCDKDEMQALMNEDKYIDVRKAKELGLISEIITPASAKKQGTVFNNKNKEEMKEEKDGKLEVKASLFERLLNKLGLSTEELSKGMDLSTVDGRLLTIQREVGDPMVGDEAYPDGSFKMPDGKTIVVANGVITEIKTNDDTDEEQEELENENEKRISELEKELKKLKKELEEAVTAKNEAEKNAKSEEDLRILNAVKIAGGEKALAKISSTYKPDRRVYDGENAKAKREQSKSDEIIQAAKAAMRERGKRRSKY